MINPAKPHAARTSTTPRGAADGLPPVAVRHNASTHEPADIAGGAYPRNSDARICHYLNMRHDGRVLPELAETVVLRLLGLVRSEDLPAIAARWLSADVVDTESVRILAGHDPHDQWKVERLLADSVFEADATVPSTPEEAQRIAVDWVTMTWRDVGDTLWAVATLAHLGESDPDFDLGLFIGLHDEWSGGWGRLEPDLKTEAAHELGRLARGDG